MIRNLSTVATIGMLMASSALAQCTDTAKAAKSTCSTTKAQVASAKADGCCATKAQTAKTDAKGCCATKAQVASADAKGSCSSNAKLASADGKTCTAKAADMPAELVMMQKIAKHGGPAMTFKVGDKTTCCPMEAEKLAAADTSTPVQFVVDKTTFVSKADAKMAYATELERYLEDLTTVQFAVGDECTRCPMTAKKMASTAGKTVQYRLGSFSFDDMEKAKALAASARKAAEEVKLAAMVGDKEYGCCTTAGKVAKTEGKTVEYKVAGTKTTCDKTADLNLKMAKVDAALNTIAAAQG